MKKRIKRTIVNEALNFNKDRRRVKRFNPPLTETFPRSRLPEMGSYLTPTYCKHTIMRTIIENW